MRECKECKKKANKEDFPKAHKLKGKVYYRHVCRDCHRNQKRDLRQLKRKKYRDYKKTLKCFDCGNEDYRVLEFHHKDDNKEFDISDKFYSLCWENLLKEINKCTVLCSNCHKIEHYKD